MMRTLMIFGGLLALMMTNAAEAAMTPERRALLNELLQERALEVLGPPPSDQPYKGHTDTGRAEAPPPGCVNPKVVERKQDPQTRRTFVRWHCD